MAEFLPGSQYLGAEGTRFNVWAPYRERVHVHIVSPEERVEPLERRGDGYFSGVIPGVMPGARYRYRLDGGAELADPASRFQPEGVFGPSEILSPEFTWTDGNWKGIPLSDYLVYELHTGTFTPEGTFDTVIGQLDRLLDLGVTAIELMPVNQFSGSRNWGYDGVFFFAPQDTYGGPDGLRRLVDACHGKGLAVVLDVVHNHLGPEGNVLAEFGPYFTDRYRTPWGAAINFDGPHSDNVRRFLIESALVWLRDYHIDALRLDALHIIADNSPYTFIEELADAVRDFREQNGRQVYLIGESSADNARLVRDREHGGYGIDAQWNDDFHHALHTLLTRENTGYYEDHGRLENLAKAFREGFVYSGEYSRYRKRRHGTSSRDIPPERFVVFSQNHDQVGNRVNSDRLSAIIDLESLKLAAGLVLLSPFVPLLFMGEEYGETAPFPYFISHTDPDLIEAVRKGRRSEFTAFKWQGEIPDPQAVATFESARPDTSLMEEGWHKALYGFYRECIRLRRQEPALTHLSKENLIVTSDEPAGTLLVQRRAKGQMAVLFCNLSDVPAPASPVPAGNWRVAIDSAGEQWAGSGGTGILSTSSSVDSVELPRRSFVLLLSE